MPLTFVLLGLAIVSVWVPHIRLGKHLRLPPWLLLFLAALGSGLIEGYLAWPALIAVGLLVGAVRAGMRAATPAQEQAFAAVAAVIALGLALHLLPGFNNPILIKSVRVSVDAPTITQYANFDKGAAGLVFLAAYAPRISQGSQVSQVAARALVVVVASSVVVFGFGMVAGYVRPDFKWSPIAGPFLITNLLFTCVAEEAFFRGYLQERLAQLMQRSSHGAWLPVAASAGLFGLAHAGGGPAFAGLAFLAGIGYSVAYAWTRRIEASVFAHFAINSIQFVAFTYPYLAR